MELMVLELLQLIKWTEWNESDGLNVDIYMNKKRDHFFPFSLTD